MMMIFTSSVYSGCVSIAYSPALHRRVILLFGSPTLRLASLSLLLIAVLLGTVTTEERLEPRRLRIHSVKDTIVHRVTCADVDELSCTSLTWAIHATNRLLVLCRTP